MTHPTIGGRSEEPLWSHLNHLEDMEDDHVLENLLDDAEAVLEAFRAGEIGMCAEVLLAKGVLIQWGQMERSGTKWLPTLPLCLWCGTSGLVHDPKCPAFLDPVLAYL